MSKKKIELVLDDEAMSALAVLQNETTADNLAEVLRDALGVYRSLRDLLGRDGDKRLAIVDSTFGELRELTIPSFQKLRPTARATAARSVSNIRDARPRALR
jgi:hypothetical protein